jgi:hypothetical protein
MELDQQLIAANEKFDALVERVNILENEKSKNETMLKVLVKHDRFFTAIATELEPKLNEIITRLDALDVHTKELDEQMAAIPTVMQPVGQVQLNSALQAFRAELTSAINESTQVARVATVAVNKPRSALPDAFSGKREDWKSFQSRLDLFFLTHDSAYPTDSDKILFAISRLGTDTAATKLMEPYIPKFRDSIELRPPLISDLKTFFTYMSKNFGVTNSHIVAEINLRNLKQKGSALDYTNKFINIAADVKWSSNDDAMISAYRLGLKEAVLEVLARDEEPTTFAAFTQLAIEIDTRQYSYFLTRPTARNTSSSSSPSTGRTASTTHTPRIPAPAPAAIESGPSPMDLGHVQHRPVDAAEKQRRKENDLCGYCGADDHWIRDCPNKPAGKRPSLKTTHGLSAVQTSSNPNITFDLGKDNA